jgi:hypothetical protein
MCSDNSLRRCSRCRKVKPFGEFSRNCRLADGLDKQCRTCNQERMRRKRMRHLAAGECTDCGAPVGDSRSRWYCRRCSTRYPTRGTLGSRNLRAQVLRAYGGDEPVCACCGQDRFQFLTLDHVENGGRLHRLSRGTQGVYRELRRKGFPSGFRVLCFNCNLARGLYGACPHAGAGATLHGNLGEHADVVEAGSLRQCTRCRQELPPVAFYPDKGTRSGRQSRCRTCTRAASVTRLRAARWEALAHYGGHDVRCICCGECEQRFLALDHAGGDGPRQSGSRRGGNTFYVWLKKEGYPPGLQVLCHNCNCAKGKNRQCPHVPVAS